MGFRGEALASIAAVSRVNMLTRTADSPVGTAYVIEGGQEVSIDDAGCPVGTTIIVRDLFYNTPARMKFLKKDATEAGYVQDICLKIALSHPHISFRLIKDGKQVLFTPGDGKLISAIHSALGKEFADTLIPLSYSFEGLSAEGYTSLPSFSRVNRNQQYFYINGRFVKILGASALDTAYKNSIMVGKFPACVINISIPPETVDVNVHPAKTEVRFSDEKRIFSLIFHAAQSSLAKFDAPSSVALSGDIAAKNKNAYKANFINESKAEEGEDLFSRAAKEKTETLAKMAEIEKRIEEKNPEDSLDKTLRLRTPTIALDYKGYNNPDEFLLKSNTKAKIDSNKENLRFEISEDITDEPLIDLTQKFGLPQQVETKNENALRKKAEIKILP